MKNRPPTLSQAERRHTTRTRILETARQQFLEHGYEAASLDAILKDAELSKGALYHHFASKEDILSALYEGATAHLVQTAQAAASSSKHPLENIAAASLGWLAAVSKPAFAKLVLEDGPQGLGWAKARAIEERHSAPPMILAFERAQEKGAQLACPPALAARVLNAALTEIALTQRARKRPYTRAEIEHTVRALLAGLAPRQRAR